MDFFCLGFIDIFSESKEGLDVHAAMILRFLHRNRLSSTVIPYPMLDHCNNMSTMRASVLRVGQIQSQPGHFHPSPPPPSLLTALNTWTASLSTAMVCWSIVQLTACFGWNT